MASEAMFYQRHSMGVKCLLCPHRCVLSSGQRGRCGVRQCQENKLYTLTDGFISSWAYDPIEKKPLLEFMPGKIIFSIGSSGCNFHCDFCQNHVLLDPCAPMKKVSDQELLGAAAAHDSLGIAYTYNEPLVNYEMVHRLSRKVKEAGLLNVVVTNGYIEKDPLLELLPQIDAWNIDYKFPDPLYREISGGEEEPVLRSIALAREWGHVEVTTLLLPGRNTDEEVFREMMKNLASIDPGIPLHLSRYYPAYRCHLPETPLELMDRCYELAKEYMKKVSLGNMPL